jgi:hypothetical protein
VEIRDKLAQKFKSLGRNISLLDRQAGDVATRPRQARDQTGSNRVARCCENYRDDRRRLLDSHDCRSC